MIPKMSEIPSENLTPQDDAGSNSSRIGQSQSVEIETRTFEETPVSFTKIDIDDDFSRTSDINLGYDIIADYSSSVEDGINLMADAEDGPQKNDTLVTSNADDLTNSVESSSHDIPTESDPIEPSAPDKLNNETVPQDDDIFPQIIFPDIIPELSTNVGSYENNADRLTPFTEAEMASLYYNQELHQHSAFVDNFIEIELRSKSVVKHPLYDLLIEYLNCRDNLRKNKIEFNRYWQDYKQLREQIWILDTSSLTEHGECQDGNPVSATHHFKIAHFNKYNYDKFVHNVNDLEMLTMEHYTTNIFNVKLYHIKIQHFIDSLCYHFNFIHPHSPILLYSENVPRGPYGADYRYIIDDLKSAVSVLFSFQRRQTKDEDFIAETRQWLQKLVSILLRTATAYDHLFLVHHIMRCPAGVGKWASHFIQPPIPNNGSHFDQYYFDHLISTLAVVLLPIESREVFLQQTENKLDDTGEMWVIVDSDGEDVEDDLTLKNSLKENDLVSFLNQIPFADIFRQILLVNTSGGEDFYDVNVATDHDVLRSIAIGTLLVNLLQQGIANYSLPPYKQFCKRLSMMIKHTACYISDHWQLFRETYIQRSIVDSAMLDRLQVEYDEFMVRVVHSLYTTHNRIGWQYLATLPFGMVATQTLWKLYQYLLHTNAGNKVLMSEEFMENLSNFPDDDVYYFLTTISNMALNRTKQDWLFIQLVTLQLFKIGFVNGAVRDKCMKSTRILIANLASKHPNLISDLILALKKDFILVGKFSMYLFKELPLMLWKPNHVDTLAFKDWLLNYSLTSWENNLTRYIFTQLNWSNDLTDADLYLPREFHCQIAIMVVKTIYIYTDDIPTAAGAALISHRVRQMSSMIRNPSPEEALHMWAWKILSKLKIHLLDQPIRVARASLTDVRLVAEIPDINANEEHMRTLSEGIARNISAAHYVALLMSNVGHNLPLICESCWDYCEIMLADYKFAQVMHVLQLVLPYYLESTDTLLKLDKFKVILIKLLSADRTYVKVAKNLISSDFPGPILSQFASLVLYHVENYSRYCLHNASQMAELWLRVLLSVWNEDCYSIAYVMDKMANAAFADDSLKQLVTNIYAEFVEHSPTNRVPSGGLSSLVNWMGYGNGDDLMPIKISLLPRSSTTVSHSAYFAFFALHLEEYYTQTETQLWNEVLKIMAAAPGKANVDGAVKKACSVLKLTPISSGSLAIYRWTQYALDLPPDHPILPLYWQRFFKLYLQRVPATEGNACVGSKFFEGTVNGNYLKKIKKKLQDCATCYEKKKADDELEKAFNDNLVILYKGFVLWLEEVRLQEPNVFLPAFPAAYNTVKLSDVLKGDENLWMEYVNLDAAKEERKRTVNRWTQTLQRENRSTRNILCFPQDRNVVGEILERLRLYDTKLPIPALNIVPSVVPEVSRESMLNASLMQENLADHFDTLEQFTGSYEIEKFELKRSLAKILDAYRNLYSDIESEVKLYASCDTASPFFKRTRTVSSLHCAGAALVTIQFKESRLNKLKEHTIQTCGEDFFRLLKSNLTDPPAQFVIACIVIELTADSLRNEMAEVKAVGDIVILKSLQNVGVSLFYKLISSYDSSVSEYFPSKLLIRKIIDKMGQSFIDEIEVECSKLLKTVLANPKLSTILIPHFKPSIVSAANFVNLYRKVTTVISSKNVTFVLDLISKFDVKEWLKNKSPKYNVRSQLIEIISLALKEIGPQPVEALLPVHKFLRRDLCEILIHDFPEHYGEILHAVLRISAEEKFSPDVWYDVLNSLLVCATAGSSSTYADCDSYALRPALTVAQIRDISRRYASELRSLGFQELKETVNILGSNFLKERLQYGLYGLYPKYTIYMEPIIMLHCMVGHATIAALLRIERGNLADRISEKIWPILLNLFSPWIEPYFTGHLNEPPAAWIQKLTDDRSVLLPWTTGEIAVANKMVATFTECVKFTLDALPASSAIMSHVCQWYATQFARESIKEHILNVVQNYLIALPWSRYLPTLNDLDLMLKVIDQYLPVCHSFLGSIFIEIQWKTVIQNANDGSPAAARFHVILLNLLIKLANEPNLRQSGKVTALLYEARQFHWHLVDAANYEYVLNWFVMSYDPRVIVQLTDEDWNGIDAAGFELLQVAAGYVTDCAHYHPTTDRKRQMFVKACVKMMLQWANRYKSVLVKHRLQMEAALKKMLDRMESVISNTVPVENQPAECAILVRELLVLINQPSGSILPKFTLQVLASWISHRAFNSPVLLGLLRVCGNETVDYANLGVILENCLVAWLNNSGGLENCGWSKVLSELNLDIVANPPIETSFIENNQILSLYALVMKQSKGETDVFVFSKLLRWIKDLKPSNENESKLPLLWSLAFGDCDKHISETRPMLLKLCAYFQQIVNMKAGWTFFNVIGANKQPVPSLRCKLLCHAMIAFILMKLSGETSEVEESAAKSAETEQKNTALVSAECVKSIQTLENLINDKHYSEYKATIELAGRLIRAKEFGIGKGDQFVMALAKQLYTEGYIHAFRVDISLI